MAKRAYKGNLSHTIASLLARVIIGLTLIQSHFLMKAGKK